MIASEVLEEEKERFSCDPFYNQFTHWRVKMREMLRSEVSLQESRLCQCLQNFHSCHSSFSSLCNLYIVTPKSLDLNKVWYILSNSFSSYNVFILYYPFHLALTSKSSEVSRRQK